LSFFKQLSIKNAEIVNFLEEKPKNEIKAEINEFHFSNLELTINPYVIASIKVEFNALI